MEKEITILNEYLSNLKLLNNNLYNLHFNVVGENFITIHKKVQELYEKVALMYDSIGERIRMFNGFPIMSLKEYEKISTIKSMISQCYTSKQVLEVIANDFTFMMNYTKDLINYFSNINDFYTVGLLNSNLEYFTKELWIISSTLK